MDTVNENAENAVSVVTETPAPAKPKPVRKRTDSKRRVLARARPRRTNKGRKFSFKRVGIGRGAKLYSVQIPGIVVTVVSDRMVRFPKSDKEYTLTGAAMKLARRKHKDWPSIQGPAYFTHKGKKLTELRAH